MALSLMTVDSANPELHPAVLANTLANSAEMIAGVVTDKAGTPAGLKAAMPFEFLHSSGGDDTTMLQEAFNDIGAISGGIELAADEFIFSNLTITKAFTLRGAGWQMQGQPLYGGSGYTTLVDGTILRSTATTGKAFTVVGSTLTRGMHLAELMIIGPGTGDSLGFAMGHVDDGTAVVRGYLGRVAVCNFANLAYLGFNNGQIDSFLGMGGGTSGVQMDNAHNGNEHNALNIERCVNPLLLGRASTNSFNGGVLQANTGTIIKLGTTAPDWSAQANGFYNYYLENAGSDYSIDIERGSFNFFHGFHLGASGGHVRMAGGNNGLIWPEITTAVKNIEDASTNQGNIFVGQFATGNIIRMANTRVYDRSAQVLELPNTDVSLRRGILSGTAGAGYLEFLAEQSVDPTAPAANGARMFTKDNGAGKTQLCVRFASGAVQVIATEP
jgi:hypothetical protein